jgi:hypothetical protein
LHIGKLQGVRASSDARAIFTRSARMRIGAPAPPCEPRCIVLAGSEARRRGISYKHCLPRGDFGRRANDYAWPLLPLQACRVYLGLLLVCRPARSVLGRAIEELSHALRLLHAVPCPICGVAAGERCLLHSGGLRNEPHLDRKLSAIEAVEAKRNPVRWPHKSL